MSSWRILFATSLIGASGSIQAAPRCMTSLTFMIASLLRSREASIQRARPVERGQARERFLERNKPFPATGHIRDPQGTQRSR
jgi:hypothetical protein